METRTTKNHMEENCGGRLWKMHFSQSQAANLSILLLVFLNALSLFKFVMCTYKKLCFNKSTKFTTAGRTPIRVIGNSSAPHFQDVTSLSFYFGISLLCNPYFMCFSQLDTLLTPGVFVFIMKWGHAHAALSLFVYIHQLLGRW